MSDKQSQYAEIELFRRIAADDAIAFQELFQQYFQILRFNALKILKSEYWAEEITQETLLHIWEIRHTLTGVENPAAWLFRIVANKCFNKMRRQVVEQRVQYMIYNSVLAPKSAQQSNTYDYDLLQQLIQEAVERLPEQQRLAYKLQQEEELSYKQIAERLNISPNTVRNHLIRAFNSIRQHVIQHGDWQIAVLFFYCL